MTNYTEKIIKGELPKKVFPKGISLVLEGGGMRGFYSAGVLDAFLEEGIMFPYIIAVSAGAANVLSYIAGQKGRNRILIEKYISKKEYSSWRNFIFKKSFFDFDYVFETVAKKHLFFDQEIFDKVDTKLLTGATDCITGTTVWFEKKDLGIKYIPIVASCSIPIISKVVKISEKEYLDGGMSSPIPIDKAIEDGNEFHVIVLTRNKGYLKSEFKHKIALKCFLKKYPNLIKTIEKRSQVYNEQINLCEKLEKEGKAILIRPERLLEVERLNKDSKKLISLYEEGLLEGRKAIVLLKEKVKEMTKNEI